MKKKSTKLNFKFKSKTNMFEKASQSKLRFQTSKGNLATEDLWDLSLESLDVIARNVNKQIKETDGESFIGVRSNVSGELTLKLDILKYIITAKQDKEVRAIRRRERNREIANLREIIADKQLDNLKSSSTDELLKRLTELENQED